MSKAPDVEFTRLFPTAHFSDQELLRSTKPLQGGAAAAGQGVVAADGGLPLDRRVVACQRRGAGGHEGSQRQPKQYA